MNIVTLARGFIQLVILLVQIAPEMVKLWKAWQSRNGRLAAPDRRRLAETVKVAVKTKDTTDIEEFLKGSSK